MAATIETIHAEMHKMKQDIDYIKRLLSEDFELSEHAKKALKEARDTPDSEYVDFE